MACKKEILVWGYALAWFLSNDFLKLLAYRIFDPAGVVSKAKATVDLNPQIATRAYELYEERGRMDGQAAGDWRKAEQEIRKEADK